MPANSRWDLIRRLRVNEKCNVASQLQTKFSAIARYYTKVSVNNSVNVLFKNSQNLLLKLHALH